MATRIKSFAEACAGSGTLNRLTPRLRPVALSHIVGSVDKAEQVTRDFLPLPAKDNSPRYRSVLQAMQEDKSLPPIELYALRDEYFAVDGHHRIAAAKALGYVYIDAMVTEFLLPATSNENKLHNQRLHFQRVTQLETIILTEAGHYPKLLEQIREHHYHLQNHGHTLSLEDAVRDWHEYVYLPVAEQLETSSIGQHFAGRTTGDLYIYLCDYKWTRSRQRKMDIGFPKALSEMEHLYPSTDRSGASPLEALGSVLAAPLLAVGRLTQRPLRAIHLAPLVTHEDNGSIQDEPFMESRPDCRVCGKPVAIIDIKQPDDEELCALCRVDLQLKLA